MKTRKWLILILVLALLAVYFIIGSDYLKQRRNNVSLKAQIAAASQELALIPVPPNDLDERLTAAQESLQAAETLLTGDTNDLGILNTILRAAETSGIKAIPLGTAPWVTETISMRDYTVFRITIQATGSFEQMLAFLARLENGEPETMILEYFSIENVPDTAGGDGSATALKADITLAVYAILPADDQTGEAGE